MADRPIITMPKQGSPAPKEDGDLVTYCPGDGDPHTTKWRGVEFKANTPIRLVGRGDLVEAARGNRFFRVGSEKRVDEPVGPPTDSMQYRAHVVDWLNEISTVDQLVSKWAADRDLRMKCEVGHDDISFLGTLVEPKLRAMRLQEGMSETDVAGVWIKHGVMELPWRS